jgi:hypothetical protein
MEKKHIDEGNIMRTVIGTVFFLLCVAILAGVFVGFPILLRQTRETRQDERDARLVRIETVITGVSVNSGAVERDRYDSNPKFRILAEGTHGGQLLFFESDIFYFNPIVDPSTIGTTLYVLLDPEDYSYYIVEDSKFREGHLVYE